MLIFICVIDFRMVSDHWCQSKINPITPIGSGYDSSGLDFALQISSE